jgi:hypothetical protein
MTEPLHRRLLTTRLRILVAMCVTALLLALAIRGLLSGHPRTPWIISPSFLLQGWLLIAVNVFFYCFVCWLGFLFIRNTIGRERYFAVGWCLGFFLWPLRLLWPQVVVPVKLIGTFGLAAALLAALALCLEPSEASDSGGAADSI